MELSCLVQARPALGKKLLALGRKLVFLGRGFVRGLDKSIRDQLIDIGDLHGFDCAALANRAQKRNLVVRHFRGHHRVSRSGNNHAGIDPLAPLDPPLLREEYPGLGFGGLFVAVAFDFFGFFLVETRQFRTRAAIDPQ